MVSWLLQNSFISKHSFDSGIFWTISQFNRAEFALTCNVQDRDRYPKAEIWYNLQLLLLIWNKLTNDGPAKTKSSQIFEEASHNATNLALMYV